MNLPQKLETKFHKYWNQDTAKVRNKMLTLLLSFGISILEFSYA